METAFLLFLATCLAATPAATAAQAPDTTGPRTREIAAAFPYGRVMRAPDRASSSQPSRPHVRGADRRCDRTQQPGMEDDWFAVDKVQHFAMAYGTAMFGYGLLRSAEVSHEDAEATALAASLAAGVGKELYDRAHGRPFSLKDLAWDALGTLAAWGMLSLNR